MKVQLPITKFNPAGDEPIYYRRGRHFRIRNDASIRTITEEIHRRKDIDSHEFIKFNFPGEDGRYTNPILTMESDYEKIPLAEREKIAIRIGRILNKKYHCQVQIVFSGNKSYHIHFRINRRNMVVAEAKAIQKYLTERMERTVKKKMELPDFVFDSRVKGRLELVRLGGGTRIQTKGKNVKVSQSIIRYWHSDFSDVSTMFPMNDAIKKLLQTDAVRKARSRAKAKGKLHSIADEKKLRRYGRNLKKVGSTVRPSHWGTKDGGKTPVMICYYGPRDRNPSCVLGLDGYFVTDSRGKKHYVGWSFNDWQQATRNDFRENKHGSKTATAKKVPNTTAARAKKSQRKINQGDLRSIRHRENRGRVAHG